jgi:thiamine kinase-like enzyme
MHCATGVVPRIPKFDISCPLVLCHMDPHMRNFILDVKGTLWLVNWANSGAFPPWLEYAHMALWADAAREEVRPPKLWTFFTRFMVGDYRRYKTGHLDILRLAWDRPSDNFYPLDYFSNLGLTID